MSQQALSDEEAAYWAMALPELERRVLCLLGNKCWHYSALAKEIGRPDTEVRRAGRHLQDLKFARVQTAYLMGEFNGRGICSSPRGEQVRLAIETPS